MNSAASIRVLGRRTSLNVQKVMWCAAEIGLKVERLDIGGEFGGNDTTEYLAKNPNGLVPTLEDGELVLWESNAIVRYLAESYGRAPWYPSSVQARGLANQWMDWYQTTLHAPMTTVFWQQIRTVPEDRDPAAFDKAATLAAKLYARLDHHLSDREYLLGNEPSMADIPVGCAAYRWFNLDVPRPAMANLEAWFGRLSARPAYQDHVIMTLT